MKIEDIEKILAEFDLEVYNMDLGNLDGDIGERGVKALAKQIHDAMVGMIGEKKEWISVEDRLPERRDSPFLTYYENQPPLMLICYKDIHNNYLISGTNRDTTGFGDNPKISHWQPLPEPPEIKEKK